MPWTLDNSNMKEAKQFTADEKKTFNKWASKVSGGTHPKTAAKTWDSDYEILKKGTKTKPHKCSIRLTQGNRVYFEQNDTAESVVVVKAGDHKEPNGW